MRQTKRILIPLILLVLLLAGCAERSAAGDYTVETVPLSRNGISLFLTRISKGETDKDLLMVHGLTYSSHQFDLNYGDYSLSRYFADQGYAVWLLDIAGYGRSEKPKDGFAVDSDYAAQDIAAAVSRIREFDQVEKIDLLGWSWGTVTTTRFASLHPESIRRLVLYAPIMTGLGYSPVTQAYHPNDWMNAADDFQKAGDGEIDATIMDPAVAAVYLSNCWRYDGTSSPAGGRVDLFTDGPLIDPDKISVPCLIIYGDHDGYMDLDLLDRLQMPSGSAKVKITGASHVMMIEKPYYRKFRESIYAFLK